MRTTLGDDFPYDAARADACLSIAVAALGSCAVHVAIGVEGDVAARIAPICSGSEIVQRGVCVTASTWGQLENRPKVEQAVEVSSSIYVAVTVEREGGGWPGVKAASRPGEAIDRAEVPVIPGRGQLEHRSSVSGAVGG